MPFPQPSPTRAVESRVRASASGLASPHHTTDFTQEERKPFGIDLAAVLLTHLGNHDLRFEIDQKNRVTERTVAERAAAEQEFAIIVAVLADLADAETVIVILIIWIGTLKILVHRGQQLLEALR